MSHWLVLLAHGSEDARWQEPFERLQQALSSRADELGGVALAYLQFCPPTLAEALQSCEEQGARKVLVLPVLMSGRGHLMRDVPPVVEAACSAVPGVDVVLSGALGEQREVLEGMVQACLRLASDI